MFSRVHHAGGRGVEVCLAARESALLRDRDKSMRQSPFARTQRLRLVMRLLLELKNRSLVGPEWQLYILSWTAETVAEDLQGLARPSSHFSTADYRAAR